MPAKTYDKLVLEQGADFNLNMTYKLNGVIVNLTGYSARMQVRKTVKSPTTVLSLTSPAGGITLGGALGTIDIYVPAATVAAIPAGSYVYDLELVSGGGAVKRLLQGSIPVTGEVTR